MKVLFSCSTPFFLAHGGSQTLTETLMRELQEIGVEVEPARWWDGTQTGDIIHFIGRPSTLNVRLAHAKDFMVVMTDLLDQTASRSDARLFLQRTFNRTFAGVIPQFTGQLNWEVYREADAMVYAVPHEWDVAKYLFGADPARGYVIPHGLENEVLRELAKPEAEGDYLISVATIDQRKNNVLLAEAARLAQVPVVFLGKPYDDDDAYFHRFLALVDNNYVRYPGFVSAKDKYRYLRGARGFVLLSQFESGCIAVFEAAAAGLPLLLSDLPWATKGYPAARALAHVRLTSLEGLAATLKRFHTTAHRELKPNFPILSWSQVAQQYRRIYEALRSESGMEKSLVQRRDLGKSPPK